MLGKLKAAALVLCLLLAGARGLGRELREVAVVTALGFDWQDGAWTATALLYDAKESIPGEQQKFRVLSQTGATAKQACAALVSVSARALFYKHNGILLLGEGVGAMQLRELAECFLETKELRLNVNAMRCEGAAQALMSGDAPRDAGEYESFLENTRDTLDCRVPFLSLLQHGGVKGWLPLVGERAGELCRIGMAVYGDAGCETVGDERLCEGVALLFGAARTLAPWEGEPPVRLAASSLILRRSEERYALFCALEPASSQAVSFAAVYAQPLREAYLLLQRNGALGALELDAMAQQSRAPLSAQERRREILFAGEYRQDAD